MVRVINFDHRAYEKAMPARVATAISVHELRKRYQAKPRTFKARVENAIGAFFSAIFGR